MSVNCNGMQLAASVVWVHVREEPTVAVSQDADDDTVAVRDSDPSPALNASTVCGGAVPPVGTGIGPTAAVTTRNVGAA